jgi:hypothetical protein
MKRTKEMQWSKDWECKSDQAWSTWHEVKMPKRKDKTKRIGTKGIGGK